MSTDVHPPNASSHHGEPDSASSSSANRRTTAPNAAGWLLMLLLIAVFVGVGAWSFKKFLGKQQPEYLKHKVSKTDLVVSVVEQGSLESANNTEITCKVRGFNTVTWVVPGGSVVQPGDELVRLDTKVVEEAYSLTKTNTHIATATLERSRADVATAEIAIDAYLKGRYRNQKKALDNRLTIAERNLENAKIANDNAKKLFEKGFVTSLEVEGSSYTVEQADLELQVVKTEIDVLDRFTKEMELETLRGNLTASRSKMMADEAGLTMEKARRRRAEEEVKACTIRADRAGLVIYPSAAAWKETPDIAQGATVRKDQVLLLMPDLSQMQIKVGIHESIIQRMKTGLKAIVTLPDQVVEAEVSKVASVTRPAGWWTGNVVKYDTIIKLPSVDGLKPGMSAEVEIIMAEHNDVLAVPVAAILETDAGDFCWVETSDGPRRRSIKLGDTNEIFVVVKGGLKEGDEVVLNPVAFLDEAKDASQEGQFGNELDYSTSSGNDEETS